jgi:hypothetical protein
MRNPCWQIDFAAATRSEIALAGERYGDFSCNPGNIIIKSIGMMDNNPSDFCHTVVNCPCK